MSDSTDILFWVGILLIISAGSFIYVATLHILPEVMNDNENHGHGYHHSNTKGEEVKHYSKGIEMAIMVVGLIAPLGLTYLEDE